MYWKGDKRTLWSVGNILCLDLHGGHKGVHTCTNHLSAHLILVHIVYYIKYVIHQKILVSYRASGYNFCRVKETYRDCEGLRNNGAVTINFILKKFDCKEEEKIKELIKISASQRKFLQVL